jgi:hypothetical protein
MRALLTYGRGPTLVAGFLLAVRIVAVVLAILRNAGERRARQAVSSAIEAAT